MKKTYIILITILILFTGCSKTNEQNDVKINTQSWSKNANADIEKRNRDLKKILDNLYLNYRFNNGDYSLDITLEEFEEYKEELRIKIPSIKSDIEFYCELKKLISKLNDGHTTLSFNYDVLGNELNLLPIELSKIENMWILTGVYKEYEKYLGYELISINNIPIKDVYNMFLDFISYENLFWVDCRFPSYVIMADILEYMNIINSSEDKINLTLKNVHNEEIVEFNFAPIKFINYSMDKFTYIIPKEELKKSNYNSYEFTEDVYMIELNYCRVNNNYSIDDFQNKVVSDIKDNKYKKIIIDLRYNLGGLSNTFEYLIDELKKLQLSYKFDVYTLIGNSTFSSGVATAVYINNNLINTFYGSPTGGKPNSYGFATYKELESPFYLYSTYIYYRCTPYDDMMTLHPDITVEQTYEDYINKIDTVVKAVLARE